jgi:hypothetical protein
MRAEDRSGRMEMWSGGRSAKRSAREVNLQNFGSRSREHARSGSIDGWIGVRFLPPGICDQVFELIEVGYHGAVFEDSFELILHSSQD